MLLSSKGKVTEGQTPKLKNYSHSFEYLARGCRVSKQQAQFPEFKLDTMSPKIVINRATILRPNSNTSSNTNFSYS